MRKKGAPRQKSRGEQEGGGDQCDAAFYMVGFAGGGVRYGRYI